MIGGRSRLSRMLMRPILFDPLDEVEGNWSREQLEAMDAAFIARVEASFAAGLESRSAAAATVQVKSSLNGSRQRAEEAAIAWSSRSPTPALSARRSTNGVVCSKS